MSEKVIPYKEQDGEKRDQIETMFDNIAKHYDFLNIFLSMGIDRYWRRKTAKYAKAFNPEYILDVATGTGDLSIVMSKIQSVKQVIGIDISEGMLEVGRKKIKKKGLTDKISLKKEDSEDLSFEDNYFDAISVGFGVRNFQHLNVGLKEMHRVLKPGAALLVLEFSKPTIFPIKQIYNFYSVTLLPFFGKITSGDNSAYTYLPKSIAAFPDGRDFLDEMKKVGFQGLKQHKLTFGIASIYIGIKLQGE